MGELLEKVQKILTSSKDLHGNILKSVCDMILSCATTHRSMKDIIQNHTFAVMVSMWDQYGIFLVWGFLV